MRIVIQTIEHSAQRYPTSGDWWIENALDASPENRQLHVRVSRLGDWRYEVLIGIHELIEAVLCLNDGVDPQALDDFDKEFELARAAFADPFSGDFRFRGRTIDADAEPGDDPEAPYRRQHAIATGMERILAVLLGVEWSEYEAAVLALG